ncbi:hypothetical protein HPB49_010948 [Dermacentor silvarum]|uniref:Uncharacterized protein n=1 Tax=Dermacentor silvarum TaxID=543639 RepID=A0ACB8CKE8_DERSI|nr:hypothetical protein HPB49_010948 [Dermacentor silvarum]
MSKAHPPELKKYMDKKLSLRLNGSRVVTGILRGFDPFMNLVLDETVEETKGGEKHNIGMVEKLDTFTKVHVVLGNEACDLDSAVAAIVTAYLLHELQPVATLLVVPVLNIARKDVKLRTEITYFFEQVDIPLDTLVCRDEIDLKKLHAQSKLSLTLVDHNLLPKEDADLQAAVQEIIDHHRLETSHRCDKTVEMVGSCCTLVAEKVLHSKPELFSPQVALLLYGTILLDTVCLSESARKTTAKDLEMVSKLQALLPELSKEEVFKPLCRARSSVDGLCLDELLRKDLKVVCSSAKRIAISSVPGELKENTMEAELGKFCKTHGYSALIILTFAVEEKSNSVQRQLAVFSSDIVLKQQLTSTLLAVGDPSLDLQVSHMSTDHLITFVQGNTQASRKVILPVVRKFLSTLDDNILPKMNEHCPQTNGSLSVNNQPCAPTTASSPEDTALRDPPFSPSDSSNSMSETAKDGVSCRGTEKVNDESFDAAVDADAPSHAAFPYRAQTVDFPDSPHLRVQPVVKMKQMMKFCLEETTSSCSPLLAQVSNLELSQPLSLASELEEYYEDSLLSGRLAVPNLEKSPLSAPLTISSSSPEFEAENEEAEPTSLPSFGFSSQNDDSYAQVKHSTPNASKTSLDPAIEQYSDDVARINLHNLPSSLDNGNSFLFEEKASGELPDEDLVVKIRSCFDEAKIKDGYVLSGRLQDLLTPKEVDEIVNNYVSYSSFIDDNILEAVVELAGGSQSLKNGNSHQSREKKVIVPNLEPFTDDSSDIVVVAYEEDDISSSLCSNGNKTASLEKRSVAHCGGGDGHGIPETETFHSLKRIDVEESVLKKLHMLPGTGIPSRFMADSSRSLSSLPVELSQQKQEVKMSTARSDPELPVMAYAEQPFNDSVDSVEQPFNDIATAADVPPELVSEERLQENDSSTPAERPSSLSGANRSRRKIKVNPDILRAQIGLDDDQKSLSSMSNKSDGDVFSPADDLATPDIETPDELGDSVLGRDDSTLSDSIPEMSAREEYAEERSWKTCNVGGVERKIDMRVIEPYKKVLSHGGYFAEDRQAIIVFSACHLPDRCRRDYDYVMDNLFLYVLSTLDQLVVENYVLIYLHGATERSKMPSFGWLKRCYQMIDRRQAPTFFSLLRKNLKGLYLVHPTFWLKTIVIMTRPFIRLEFENMIKEKKKKLGSRKVLPGPRQVTDDAS